jgi:hypothetical protein
MPFPLLAAAIVLVSNFEGANIHRMQQSRDGTIRVELPGETDQDHRNRQANWYYFRLDGVRSRPLTIEVTGLPGEYNYQPNKGAVTGDTPPWYSYDNLAWRPWQDFTYDAATPKLTLRITPSEKRIWIAHIPPYTRFRLDRLRRDISSNPAFREREFALSAGQRSMYLWTITEPGLPEGRKVVWLMARQHSWEAATSYVAEGLVRFLLSSDPQAARIRRDMVFQIMPMCDPDGVARGGVRFNVNGYDLNRNWDAINEEKMPEIYEQHDVIRQWIRGGRTIDLFLAMHNTETGEYLEGPPAAGDGKYKELGARFARLLEEGTSFSPSRPLSWAAATTTEGKPGRMTVVQGLWKDFQIPSFLTEQRVAVSPKLGRRPTVEDRLEYGRRLALVFWRTLCPETSAP